MPQYESFYRGKPLGAEPRTLPAEHYNALRLLLDFSGKPCVFVPIRTLQYMAVIDHEEVIFVDSQVKVDIEFAWRYFRPQVRSSLTEPVPYLFEYYEAQALETMKRAQVEFYQHVQLLAERMRQAEPIKAKDNNNIISLYPD
ncbi:MAG: hypothetical protein WAQ53_13040 [Thiofilum sp.]|uniref:hypothetical protein n=1 Tax=Thiofilum sp. TaxID=2212733 RepID=UPI0025F8D755|nr:hypothetical protein [Thiofilum sp.]MBK8453758.1 hypothetical protein [Thiofilum sp.]